MKFVCVKCESFMGFENVEVPGEQSLGVTFSCKSCGAKIAMVTNAGETAMVQALGVQLGGRSAPATPMELTRTSLKEGEMPSPTVQKEMLATEMAKLRAPQSLALGDSVSESGSSGAGKCPFSSMVAAMSGATGMGSTGTFEGTSEGAKGIVALQWSPEAQERLERVPSFMRPMIQMGVEGYAQRIGASLITPEIMDASKNAPSAVLWTDDAERRLENIPSFVRPMARKEIERMAVQRGETQVSAELLEEAKQKFVGLGY